MKSEIQKLTLYDLRLLFIIYLNLIKIESIESNLLPALHKIKDSEGQLEPHNTLKKHLLL